ncbi:MAG: hypothetical protein JWL96_2060 [Sphingomonas bacterium]|uniref:hypothetical protein n=1 Tax=Sphingomonas bacterium TaxID=1895847 RepID=UPI0026287E34|nr:hypothetical protein [Sphingomonas bacterium]MDB5709990.1 hypothetical protein [Sphingomonas bacterium]
MGGVVAAAGAARARAQREVVSLFMSNNAVGADKAIPFTTSRHLEQKCFDRFRDLGVIQSATNGGYYLDIPAYDAYRKGQRRIIVVIMLIALAVMTIGVAVGIFAGNL